MDGSNSNEAPKDFRPQFTSFINQRRNNTVQGAKHKKCTVEIVNQMNQQLASNNVPMSEGHYRAATESIDRGDNIVRFTVAENQHVLSSSGRGFAYRMGYIYHSALGSSLNDKRTLDEKLREYQENDY